MPNDIKLWQRIIGSSSVPLPHIAINVEVDSPDSKVHGANMGSTWGRQDPGGSHVGHVNLAIWASNPSTKIAATRRSEFWTNNGVHIKQWDLIVR